MIQYRIFLDKEMLSIAAAELFKNSAAQSIAEYGRFVVCLSGGSTPSSMYKLLVEEPYRSIIDWEKVFFFWGDERCVPLDSSDNNAFTAIQLLLSKVPVPSENIFRIHGEGDPKNGASSYQTSLEQFFKEESPIFDLVFLGMGDDAHTASLFPWTSILNEKEAWVDSVYVEKLDTHRISLTPKIINQAKNITFLIGGANKAEALNQVLNGPDDYRQYPSQLITRHAGNVMLYLDNEAASSVW